MLSRLVVLVCTLFYGALTGIATSHDHHADHGGGGHDCAACQWNLHATADALPATLSITFYAVGFPAPVPVAADVPVILCALAASRAPPEAV
jgi:hypothetical protein